MLKGRRRALHGKVARWLAARSQGDSARAGDFLALTAQHFALAGDDANAAEFHARAAEHAAGRLAHPAALAHVRQALAILDQAAQDDDQALLRWRLLRAREKALDIQGERGRQAMDLDAMEVIAKAMDDDARRAHVEQRRAVRWRRIAEHAECERAARQAVALADRALALRALQVAAGASDDGLTELRLLSLRMVGLAVMNQGRLDEAQELLQQVLSEARARGLRAPQMFCLNSLGMLHERQDDRVRALAVQRECLTIACEIGDRRNEAVERCNIGLEYLAFGDLSAAQRELNAGLRQVRQNGDRAMEPSSLCGLSALALWQGEVDHARALALEALDTANAVQARNRVASASVCLADAEAARGQTETAMRAYVLARDLALEIGSGWRFDASAGLAALLLAQGDSGGALQALQPLLSAGSADVSSGSFTDAEWPRRVQLTIHRVLAAASDPRATGWLERAHRTLMTKADEITDRALRQMFLTNLPHHVEIQALWGAHPARLPAPHPEGFEQGAAGH